MEQEGRVCVDQYMYRVGICQCVTLNSEVLDGTEEKEHTQCRDQN